MNSFLRYSPVSALIVTLGTFSFGPPVSAQGDRYFDVNGIADEFGLTGDGTYDWDLTSPFWNTASNGNGGSPGPWVDGYVANFDLRPLAGGQKITLNLQQDIQVGGMVNVSADHLVVVRSTALDPETNLPIQRTLSLAPGAIFKILGGQTTRGITIGDNVNILQDFEISAGGAAGVFRMNGTGLAYSGKITVSGAGSSSGLWIDSTSRLRGENGAETRLVLNSGRLGFDSGTTVTIKELSGNGGVIANAVAGTLVVDQNTDTFWAGAITPTTSYNRRTSLHKKGVGRLSLTGTTTHLMDQAGAIRVEGGALYIAARIQDAATATASKITVDGGAILGGTFDTNKGVILSAATSQLDPGMFGAAGTMTLERDLIATLGGTFNFTLGGEFEENLRNSQLLITGGTLTLGGSKTVNLLDLGLQELQANVAYTLLDASHLDVTRTAGWDEDWVLGLNTTQWRDDEVVLSFSNNRLQVTFMPVPEPSTVLLLVGAGLFLARRRAFTSRKG